MALFDNAMFAPQNYGGVGGLLGNILKMAQANPVQSPGFEQTQDMSARSQAPLSPQSPFAARANFFPQQRAAPAQAPAPSGPSMGGIGDTLGSLFSLIAPRHAAAFQQQQQLQQAKQLLSSKGLDAGTAGVVASNPALLAQVMGSHLGIKDRTDDIREFEYAKTQGFKGSLLDWMSSKRAGAGEYGLTPIWGVDDKGNPVMMQPGKSGTAIQSVLPSGVTLANKPIVLDTPTEKIVLDPITRQAVARYPKDVQGAARQEAIGQTQGKTEPIIPAAETTVNNALQTIDKLRNHPGLEYGTGAIGKVARSIPGTEAYNFDALNKQAAGQTFMAAREALKGAGQVTDFEGAKGEQAVANLDAAQTKEQYLKALDTLEHMMKQSVADLKTKAGRQPQTIVPQAGAPSAAPSIDDLVKKYSR